jgi:hypothetical protein
LRLQQSHIVVNCDFDTEIGRESTIAKLMTQHLYSRLSFKKMARGPSL